MAKVILVCGRICCGKTTYAHRLRRQRRAVVLSMDEVMLSLLGEYLGDQHDLYAKRTQEYLLKKSLEIIETGFDVILDWGPWTKAGRAEVRQFFASHGIECELHCIQIDEEEWRRRIAKRNSEARGSAYLVDDGLMQKFLSRYEACTQDEGLMTEG